MLVEIKESGSTKLYYFGNSPVRNVVKDRASKLLVEHGHHPGLFSRSSQDSTNQSARFAIRSGS